MNIYQTLSQTEVTEQLLGGAIGIIPTDTLYGIVARAADSQAVQRLFTVRQRDAQKSCIVLLADAEQLTDRSVLRPEHTKLMQHYWPGPVSLVLPTSQQTPEYLKRADATVAYRVPADTKLRDLLRQTGPLIAPSANLQGQPVATTLQQATGYFGEMVEFYVDGGDLSKNQPSSVLRVAGDGSLEVLRGNPAEFSLK